ncbi:histone-like nucleoid-structuring protein Lsr2 [Mycolicibacterium arenosum]|uniref:Lsr2 family protein n=1 Tax=Mycolicibacterium arenosum TaxID=2952157 RepID=A0ABT1M446_9MYCO|nr:Lsr2 family protein [Mycolicibacterium sp. CAU 1645]MCP9273375.1 Lsr2 family protein [Mycolicibacterium sp. CAU 1645]
MAERIVRQLIDDIDGSDITEGGEQLEFSVRGVTYRLDLSSANAAKFDKVLKPYIDAAEKVSGADSPRTGAPRRARKSARGSSGSSEQLAAIRAWARKKGYEVSDRGRIKADIVEAFNAAH